MVHPNGISNNTPQAPINLPRRTLIHTKTNHPIRNKLKNMKVKRSKKRLKGRKVTSRTLISVKDLERDYNKEESSICSLFKQQPTIKHLSQRT